MRPLRLTPFDRRRCAELERFRTDHGDKRLAMMHKAALQTIINGKTPASQRNLKRAMRGFLDHCLELDFIKVDPLADDHGRSPPSENVRM
jgi:hypothetical protein